jgi:hypothetical protein
MPLQHYVNHISLIVDRSGSMANQPVVKVFDKELEYLKQRSVELNQETRISIYLFDNTTECLTFDMDVMRFKSLQGYWKVQGMTALLDAVGRSIDHHLRLPIDIAGDHAFLQYIITDGMENASRYMTPDDLSREIDRLPDNWTTAILVPDARGKFEAKKFGFAEESIAIWDTSVSNAFEKVGRQFSTTVDNYMAMRASGVRGTKGLFTLDSSGLSKKKLTEVPASDYTIYAVTRDGYIREYVESITNSAYRTGSVYYQPTKEVIIQDHKNILVQNVKDSKVYEGQNLRQLLGLPSTTTKVTPGSHKDWRIFVQSTSTNRRLFPGTNILIHK